MIKFKLHIFYSFIFIIVFSSCGKNKIQDFNLTYLQSLPSVMTECSGWVTDDDSFLAINDSGNAPFIYKLNDSFEVIDSITIPGLENIDWEAIAFQESTLYVADIGNNEGNRRNLRINVLQRSEDRWSNKTEIPINYPDQTHFEPRTIHNYDAETLIPFNSELLIFSKSRQNAYSKLYVVNNGTVLLKDSIRVPILVTDGLYLQERKLILLLCNQTEPDGFSTYISLNSISDDYKLNHLADFRLELNEQAEAICQINKDQFLIATEKEIGTGANIYKLELEFE